MYCIIGVRSNLTYCLSIAIGVQEHAIPLILADVKFLIQLVTHFAWVIMERYCEQSVKNSYRTYFKKLSRNRSEKWSIATSDSVRVNWVEKYRGDPEDEEWCWTLHCSFKLFFRAFRIIIFTYCTQLNAQQFVNVTVQTLRNKANLCRNLSE